MNTNLKILGGFLVGSIAGAAAGLLLAPKSGKDTRKDILDKSKEWEGDLKKSGKKKMDALKRTYNDKVEELAKESKEGINHIKEKVSMN